MRHDDASKQAEKRHRRSDLDQVWDDAS